MIPIATGLTYNESRALEQAIISAFTIGRLANIVRSVSKKNLVLLLADVLILYLKTTKMLLRFSSGLHMMCA